VHGCLRERYRSFDDELLVAELSGLIHRAERGAASQTTKFPARSSRQYELRCLRKRVHVGSAIAGYSDGGVVIDWELGSAGFLARVPDLKLTSTCLHHVRVSTAALPLHRTSCKIPLLPPQVMTLSCVGELTCFLVRAIYATIA
jgi:hypothetical protein